MDFQLVVEPIVVLPGDMDLSIFHFTAAALKSLPSWNLTPLARCKVTEGFVGSLFTSQEVARPGERVASALPLIKNSIAN